MDKEIKTGECSKNEHPSETTEMPMIIEKINIEELAVDGICGIY